MCQQFPLFLRCLTFITTLLISFGVTTVIVRLMWPQKYKLFRDAPSEGSGFVLGITGLLFFIINAVILKCW
jgi:hypothetical protein